MILRANYMFNLFPDEMKIQIILFLIRKKQRK